MILPIGWISSLLLTSSFSLGHSAAKNLIFRISSLLLQYAVFKTISYIAYRLTAYTSFLMLMEDFIQKLYFLKAHGIQRNSWIVLAFAILFPAAGVYDTCLWMLDAPGYVVRSTVIGTESFSNHILPSAPYILNIPGGAGDINLERTLSADLYTQNVILLATHLPISQEVVAPKRNLSSDQQPRIWLDDDGWSVGLDLDWPIVSNGPSCTPNSTTTQQRWSCQLNNTSASHFYAQSFGDIRIWWDSAIDSPHILSPTSGENIWFLLGPGGSSAVMKQLFTLTKGQRRHTFLETARKTTMQTSYQLPFLNHEVVDFVRRAWNNNPGQIVNPEIQALVDGVMLAQSQGVSVSMGLLIQEPQPFAIRATVLEFLTVVNPTNTSDQQFSSLRVRSLNATLLRSEVLSTAESPQPFESCPGPFANVATGGRIRGTTCSNQMPEPSDQAMISSFKGQIDASLTVILPSVLGTGNANTSQSAFDPNGQSWLLHNQAHLDELMATRGFILSGNSEPVKIVLQEPVAAISYLQLILVAAPALLAILSWILMAGDATSHYKHSFLAAICATTHVSDNSCRRIGYMKYPPLIELRKLRRHVLVGTPGGGTIANVERDQVVAYSLTTEPLTLPDRLGSKVERDIGRGGS